MAPEEEEVFHDEESQGKVYVACPLWKYSSAFRCRDFCVIRLPDAAACHRREDSGISPYEQVIKREKRRPISVNVIGTKVWIG